MKAHEVAELLDAEILCGSPEVECRAGYSSDLLSDVMANAEEGSALITIQAHANTVAVASHVDLPLIVVCNDRPVPEEMLEAARENNIAICRTSKDQFSSAGLLYARLQTGQ
ncbi:MAG: DRTGG domain-containing protein [Spirochaetales bacterium]